MKILLDIDGVLVTAPAWRPAEIHEDGFLAFNRVAAANLSTLITETNASIILTTTHRISYSTIEWKAILRRRGIIVPAIDKINGCSSLQELGSRSSEIEQWVAQQASQEAFVILDDDASIGDLSMAIKAKWVKTSSLIGFDNSALNNARRILLGA